MKYLISACLVGENVRYDAKNCLHLALKQLIEQRHAVCICPEVSGGLSTPRLAAEIRGGNGFDVLAGKAQVITSLGQDVSAEFICGAQCTLALAQHHQVSHVILKSNSPSCGSDFIYDGSFTGEKIQGMGVTTALLQQHGFEVMTEQQFIQQLSTNTQ
ncbi:DUF523 domain-containing protein [Acinetobacter sp. Marseille-Q1618]|uniref:DUF523 domain-containing protein n=1 Tax=Acinetobacter sp. Marseille-Q1618 TaxID=2697502 RepID=UPI001570B2DC|nr:DUF523 domain-containing protein [Acinetobacter sp. Marseille-Q1618]